MNENFKNKSVLVSGSGGSIGSELVLQLSEIEGIFLILVDISELALFSICNRLERKGFSNFSAHVFDLSNYDMVKAVFFEKEVDIILHAAAYKHVHLSRTNSLSYFVNNVSSTINLIELAKKCKSEFLLVSTDKAVEPINVMGFSKRICEFFVLKEIDRQLDSRQFRIVRFGNVLNSSGSVIPIFTEQIKGGGPVTVTDPRAKRFFMSISQAVNLIISIIKFESDRSVFCLAFGEGVLIDSIARSLIEEAGFRPVERAVNREDMEIVYIGLREGEKLEEILSYGPMRLSGIQGVNYLDEEIVPSEDLLRYLCSCLDEYKVPSFDKINWRTGELL